MNEDKDKKIYEIALLLKREEDLPAVVTLIREHQGELISEPRAKKLALAYKIKGNTEAVFVSTQFNAFPEGAKNLEHDLVSRADVIRSMILVSPPPPERESSPIDFSAMRRGRPARPRATSPREDIAKAPAPRAPLSNEALEKKIEEFL